MIAVRAANLCRGAAEGNKRSRTTRQRGRPQRERRGLSYARRARYHAAMDVLLMSPPRVDWRVHGRANVFSQDNAQQTAQVPRGAALHEWLALADAIVD